MYYSRFCAVCGAIFTELVGENTCRNHSCIDVYMQQQVNVAERILDSAIPKALDVLGFESLEEYQQHVDKQCGVEYDVDIDCLSGEIIYFVQCGKDGPIKIGYTQNLKQRMSAMQVYNPHRLKVVCVFQGGSFVESELHEIFKQYRIRGEWFEFSNGFRETALKHNIIL